MSSILGSPSHVAFHSQADVVIVGGGLAGLSCAVALCGRGLDIALVEASDMLGGRARSWTDEQTGDVVDVGPHIFLSEYPNIRALLDQLGTHDQVAWQDDKLIRLVGDGECLDMRAHPLTPPLHLLPSISKVGAVSMRDKASNSRATWIALKLSERDFMELDRTDAASWLRECGVSERFIEWFWASACMSLLNVPLEQCSAGALMRVYGHLVTHRRYRFGFATCGLAELFAPQAVQLLGAANARVHMRTRATSVLTEGERVVGVQLSGGGRIAAHHCVLATPPLEAQALLPARVRGDIAAHVFTPCPYISVYLWLDRKITRERFWYRLWKAEHLNGDFYDLSNIRAGWSERNSVIASNIIYSHRAHDLSDQQIVSATLRELVETMPHAAQAQVIHSRVHRIPLAIPCPAPGTERLRPPTATAIAGLLLAGDWTRTALPACMESAVRSGWLAAEAILADVGQPRSLARSIAAPEGLAGFVHRRAQQGKTGPLRTASGSA